MTNQELYTKVRKHLLTQMERSHIFMTVKGETCLYRGPRGLKCAIGCLIPDTNYTPALESRLAGDTKIIEAAGLNPNNVQLAVCLQRVHDSLHVSRWEKRLNEIAKEFQLVVEA